MEMEGPEELWPGARDLFHEIQAKLEGKHVAVVSFVLAALFADWLKSVPDKHKLGLAERWMELAMNLFNDEEAEDAGGTESRIQ